MSLFQLSLNVHGMLHAFKCVLGIDFIDVNDHTLSHIYVHLITGKQQSILSIFWFVSMFVYIFVCLYVCLYVYLYVYLYVFYIRLYLRLFVCVYERLCVGVMAKPLDQKE